MNQQDKVLVFGATGNIGGAATRELLGRGWQVRAVTRNPQSEKARALAALGAEVVQGDMDDRGSLEAVFDGMRRVFSVQNWVTSGMEGEIRQGKLVADIARSVGVKHLVYGSAGTGDPHTGVPHFDSKLVVEAYLHTLGIPFTIVRPGPFMELLSQKEFYPALGVWGTQTRILGWEAPIPWVAVRDIGTAIANIFADPATWIGQDITLIGDVKSMRECREMFLAVNGKKPFGLSLPPWLFQKMAGEEWIIMWRWLKDLVAEVGRPGLWQMAKGSRRVCPDMIDLRDWLEQGQEHARHLAGEPATTGQQQGKRATGST
jgi:uncharacterized protein YbjT (DUF2867 family)